MKTTPLKLYVPGTFGYDLQYLSAKDNQLAVLKSADGQAQVIVSPAYQAKVFTSTAAGEEGQSLGYLNYKALDQTGFSEHMNGYGGENRLWIGPEGGRYSVFFQPGTEQVYANWYTPAPVDTEPWGVKEADTKSVAMAKEMEVANYMGSKLRLGIDRRVQLLESAEALSMLGGIPGAEVKMVAYTTENRLTNLNDFAWTRETGTVCLWVMDMFNTSPQALTVVPYHMGSEAYLGRIVTSEYFGEIPANRLQVKDGLIFLKTDGRFRSKIGLNALRTKGISGNYDPVSGRLTVSTFDVNKQAAYLNQEWDTTKDPAVGDIFNGYNDGPLEDGSIMGPFLELESASPGAFIYPGESLTHHHQVFHFTGEAAALTAITEVLFGISVDELIAVF